MLYFDNDYMAGAHPKVMRRIEETNLEHTTGYGTDPYTARARALILKTCGLEEGIVHFLIGGTQTNATVIDALLRHHEGVLASETAHINVHEVGAIEATGHKVLTLPTYEGKIRAKDVDRYVRDFYKDNTYEHMVAPGMVYISFPTEVGTLYSRQELQELSKVCHIHDIPLYTDGARLGYGLTSPMCDVTIEDIAKWCDVFYIGGTKVGALFGEAVVTHRPELLPHFMPLIKQHGGLLAKGRLLGVQFETLFSHRLYWDISRQAVECALRLKAAFVSRGYRLYIDSPTNQQFIILPNEIIDSLRSHVSFELWGIRGETETPVRFVTSWATQPEDIDELISYL